MADEKNESDPNVPQEGNFQTPQLCDLDDATLGELIGQHVADGELHQEALSILFKKSEDAQVQILEAAARVLEESAETYALDEETLQRLINEIKESPVKEGQDPKKPWLNQVIARLERIQIVR